MSKLLEQMSKHDRTCKYKGAGRWLASFRLTQEIKSKTIHRVPQLKCAGCGCSFDYDWRK